jgi:hypothetical protein
MPRPVGIRLHHPTERDCIWLVRHPRKDYWLRLDGAGDVIVSTTIYERLKEVALAGLIFLNEVKAPPNLVVGGTGRRRRLIRFNPHTKRIEAVEEAVL